MMQSPNSTNTVHHQYFHSVKIKCLTFISSENIFSSGEFSRLWKYIKWKYRETPAVTQDGKIYKLEEICILFLFLGSFIAPWASLDLEPKDFTLSESESSSTKSDWPMGLSSVLKLDLEWLVSEKSNPRGIESQSHEYGGNESLTHDKWSTRVLIHEDE